MANTIVAEQINVSDSETIVLVMDDYAKSFVRYIDEPVPAWDKVWYDLLNTDGFDDVLALHVQANFDTGTVIIDEMSNLPVPKEEDEIGSPNFYIA